MRIELVGPGRLGRTLALLLDQAGHDARLRGRGEPVDPDADLVWLTVPDHAIGPVAAQLPIGPPVAHASGATDLAPLAPHPRRGSLHPLMSFPGPEVSLPDLTDVPAAIDGSDDAIIARLESIARDLGMHPVRVPGDRRLYHAAAVIAGNLSTVLLAEAGRVLSAAGVDPVEARAMLAPLAHASLHGALDDPAAGLTGPVARRDDATLAAHRDALAQAGLQELLPWVDEGLQRARRIRDESR